MAGIKPLDMAGNYNVGIGWELNRWLQTVPPVPVTRLISARAFSGSGMKFKTRPDTAMFIVDASNGNDSAFPTLQFARLPSRFCAVFTKSSD